MQYSALCVLLVLCPEVRLDLKPGLPHGLETIANMVITDHSPLSGFDTDCHLGKLMRFIKEIQGHMRLRASGDRHEIRQQYLPLLWQKLVKELQVHGKDSISNVIELMDSYYLTKDDWDAVFELGVGPMEAEHVKIDTQTKTAFTRLYNQASHPLPYMKASQIVAPKKKDKEKPDIEDALEESDSGASSGDEQVVLDDEEPLDLKKDKYIAAPKKRAAKSKKGTSKEKRKGKVKDESGMSGEDDQESEEDIKPKKGAVAKSKARGRPKK